MTILITNDDGIEAEGIQRLAECLHGLDTLVAAAPLQDCSGIGHSITLRNPVTVVDLPPDRWCARRLAIEGTPADAVKFALTHALEERPALVVSGINPGPNVGINLFYSGTVAAAIEGVIQGIPALAVSIDLATEWEWSGAMHYARRVARMALELGKHPESPVPPFCLNLNAPPRPPESIRGLRVTRHGRSGFEERFHPVGHPLPADTYRIDGEMRIHDPDDTFDARALAEGWATLTPLRIDLTDSTLLERLLARGDLDVD